jgi:hypothetical protein
VTEDRSAALVVRVWLEDGTQFRARLAAVASDRSDAPGDDVTIAVASSPSDVLAAVGEWLDIFVGNGTSPY